MYVSVLSVLWWKLLTQTYYTKQLKHANIEKILVIRLPIHFWIDLGFVEVEVREFDLNSFTGIGVKIISARDVRWVRVGIPRATYRTLGGGSLSDILVAFGWNKKNRITISI